MLRCSGSARDADESRPGPTIRLALRDGRQIAVRITGLESRVGLTVNFHVRIDEVIQRLSLLSRREHYIPTLRQLNAILIVRAQKILARSGNAPVCADAIASIRAKPQICENAVKTNALARLDPNPPAKSAAPHRNTAVTEYAAGVN